IASAFGAAQGAPCRVVWNAGNTGFTFLHPGAELQNNQQYTFTLLGGFYDPAGVTNTVDHNWNITTEPAPDVRTLSPPDGSTAVAVDAPLIVTFSTPMNPMTTERAISLSPAIDGTRVAPSRDLTRFLLLPGHPLVPDTTYRLIVSDAATDAHGERLRTTVSSAFTAGTMSGGDHAVLLLGRPGEAASEVAVALLASATTGDPIDAETVLTAPRCSISSGCGSVAFGDLFYAYTAATLSPGSHWLAVVEQDLSVPGAPLSMAVLNPATGAVRALIPGASKPSWSPDGSAVAFATERGLAVYRPAVSSSELLPGGDPLAAPPEWGPQSELLVLSTFGLEGAHVELADAVIQLRYPVPGLQGSASNPALSPDATQLAVRREGAAAGTWLVSLGAGRSTPRLLDPRLTPYGWIDTGTLLGTIEEPDGSFQPVTVTVSTGEEAVLPITLDASALTSLDVAPSGRLLAYLGPGTAGLEQAVIENADGSEAVPIGAGGGTALQAVAVSLN
ncbi:MAG: Ig-like domain-containing protein, partial [Candidatus Dormibacteraeota bacterium]|nr:Ig-like domain-containing protein [Candidatus Dormibacteraeota bacterium]